MTTLLLGGAVHGVALGEHGDGDEGCEPLAGLDLGDNLLDNLMGDGVLGPVASLPDPAVGTPDEILIFNVDKMLGFPNRLNIGPQKIK